MMPRISANYPMAELFFSPSSSKLTSLLQLLDCNPEIFRILCFSKQSQSFVSAFMQFSYFVVRSLLRFSGPATANFCHLAFKHYTHHITQKDTNSCMHILPLAILVLCSISIRKRVEIDEYSRS